MDLTSKKTSKNVIKLALCIQKASLSDLVLLASMIDAKTESDDDFYEECIKVKAQIKNNAHLCALLGIKDNK